MGTKSSETMTQTNIISLYRQPAPHGIKKKLLNETWTMSPPPLRASNTWCVRACKGVTGCYWKMQTSSRPRCCLVSLSTPIISIRRRLTPSRGMRVIVIIFHNILWVFLCLLVGLVYYFFCSFKRDVWLNFHRIFVIHFTFLILFVYILFFKHPFLSS